MAGATTNNFSGQRVLVTGAAGFIGSHLCRRLAELRATLHVVTRRVQPPLGFPATAHALDLADGPAVDRLFADVAPDYIFHLASRVSGSRELAEVGPTFGSNLASTVHLLRNVAAGGACKRIVLAGSLEASDEPDDVPSSPYAASKAAAALYGRMFHSLYGTPVTIARLFMVYGPGQPDTRKLVPYVACSLLAGKTPRLSSGSRPVDWVYVDDVVDSLLGCATTPGLEGRTIDVGTGQMTSVRGVAEQIARLVGKGQPVFGAVGDRSMEQVRAADPTDATRMIGRPLMRLDDGLARTVAWFRDRVERGAIDPASVED